MNIDEIAKMVNRCAQQAREGSDYGSHDHNRGVGELRRAIIRKLAWEYAKSTGLARIAHIRLSKGDNDMHFRCRVCDDYSNRKLSKKGNGLHYFYCQECGALWQINRQWGFAFNDEWSGQDD